jgi:fucose permease
MFVFGIAMALLGAVMPVLSAQLGFGLDRVGLLFLVMNAAMLVASLLIGPVTDRVGMKGPILLGAVFVGLALVAVARAMRFGDLLPAIAALGVGGATLNACTNILVADLHDDPGAKGAALNRLGVFFGIGALLLPFSVGSLLARAGLAGLLVGAAGLCGALALVAAVLRFPPPKQAHAWPLAGMSRLLRMPLVLALACLLFFESANEFMLGGYFSTFLTQELQVPVDRASYMLAAFWGALMVSRVVLSRARLGLDPRRVVTAGALVAAGGALTVALAPNAPLAAAGIIVSGFALGGIFPTVLGVAGAAFPSQSGTVFGLLFTVALTGGTLLPSLAGQLAASAGLRAVFVLVAVNFTGVALLNTVVHRLRHARPANGVAPAPPRA